MGSFDPMLSSFAPTKYLGTTNSTVCITNYDQAAFVTGTSSELFNEFNTTVSILPKLWVLGILKYKIYFRSPIS